MPVGRWVRRTAESVVLTPWPPGPEDRYTSTRSSDSSISMWSVCSTTGEDLDAGERGLTAALVVEGRDPDEAVGALLDGERAVGVRHVHREGGRLDAGLFGVRRLVELRLVAVALGPAEVHALELLREVGGVDAAGLGADGDDGLAGVVLAGEEGADLHLVQRLLDGGQFVLRLGAGVRVVLLLGHLEEDREVVDPAAEGLGLADLGLEVAQLAGDLLRRLRVVPQEGAAACSSRTTTSALSVSRSRTASIDSMVEERDLSSSDTSTTATPPA